MINIALTALPQPTLIKTAILNMDQNILTKEAVEVMSHAHGELWWKNFNPEWIITKMSFALENKE